MSKTLTVIDWILRLTIAVILLQTLYFKFSGHEESVILFTKLGVEPWGRIGTGVLELVAGLLIIFPATALWGALMSLGLMSGAIASHLFIIGIESQGDGGQLFMLAIIVLIMALVVCILRRNQLLALLPK